MDASTLWDGLLSTDTSFGVESSAGVFNDIAAGSDSGPNTSICSRQSTATKAGYRALSECYCTCYAGLCRADTSYLLDGSPFI